MKKILSLLIAFLMCFALSSCATQGANPEQETETIPLASRPPILGVQIVNGDEAGFYALTKTGSYTWIKEFDKNGEATLTDIADGIFCLDADDICTFTREYAGKSIVLQFTGDVEGYKIYSAEISSFNEENRADIIDEKYLVSENMPQIIFPEAGEYYYVVNVNYKQGEVSYGFILR